MVQFRFDPVQHEYIDLVTGQVFPHITGLLEQAGLVDDRWYTEESSIRGTEVHRLTAAYDLGNLDVDNCEGLWRGYLLAYVKAVSILQPTVLTVEVPKVHPRWLFGGRPDRNVLVGGVRGILEVKTTQQVEKADGPPGPHRVQTALQAILEAPDAGLPPEAMGRWCLYLKDKGKFKLVPHDDRRDLDEALRILDRYARAA